MTGHCHNAATCMPIVRSIIFVLKVTTLDRFHYIEMFFWITNTYIHTYIHTHACISGRNKGQKLVGHFLKIGHFCKLSTAIPLKMYSKFG